LVRSLRDRSPTSRVVLDCLFKAGHASIVHIWSSNGNVSQCRRLELSNIRWLAGDFVSSRVRGGVRQRARHVVQAGVVELDGRHLTTSSHRVGEVVAPVTHEARQRPAGPSSMHGF